MIEGGGGLYRIEINVAVNVVVKLLGESAVVCGGEA